MQQRMIQFSLNFGQPPLQRSVGLQILPRHLYPALLLGHGQVLFAGCSNASSKLCPAAHLGVSFSLSSSACCLLSPLRLPSFWRISTHSLGKRPIISLALLSSLSVATCLSSQRSISMEGTRGIIRNARNRLLSCRSSGHQLNLAWIDYSAVPSNKLIAKQ